MEKKKIGIFIFDEVEILDFAGPFEVFASTKIVEKKTTNKSDISLSPFRVFTISERKKKIKTTGGLKIFSDYNIKDHPSLDILLIPGGIGTRPLLKNQIVLDWIKENKNIDLLCTVCTGSLLLAKAGLLKNRAATTHWLAFDILKKISPTTKIMKKKRFVYDKFFTSAGVSAGIDLSLKVVEKFYGRKVAKKTAKYMDYISENF